MPQYGIYCNFAENLESLNTSPCKICCKAFQHFLESHVKSVRRLRKKEGGGAVKTIRRAALHETAYHCQRNAVSKVTIRRFGNIRKLDSERKKL